MPARAILSPGGRAMAAPEKEAEEMYFEVFLLDNLLLDLLIVRLAAALLSVRPPLIRQIGVSLVSALIAAAAAYAAPRLTDPRLRLPMLAVMALAVPFKSFRGFAGAAAATALATLTVGGAALAAALIFGGSFEGGIFGGIELRAAIVIAASASLLPRCFRSLLKRRLKNETAAEVVILHKGILRRFTAIVDTGNTLTEPLSGLPVAVVRCRAFVPAAKLEIPVSTAAGSTTLKGFIPERISVNGRETFCAVALSDERLSAEALIPPELCLPAEPGSRG